VSFFGDLPPSGAVVVSKKTFKTSVARHRAKRRLVNALKRALESRKYAGGIIVYPNTLSLTAPFSAIVKGLENALTKFSKNN
jgi:ribonuclease P protein component